MNQKIINFIWLLSWVAVSGLSSGADCFAKNISKEPLCGVLDTFEGDVQILDSTKTQLLNISSRSTISCGAWISVNQGWVRIKHVNGPHIHLGNQTLIQLVDFRNHSQFKGDHSVLYKGEMYVHADAGQEEFHVLTSGARVRLHHGQIVVVYDAGDDQTQLIALEKEASLENRFESTRRVKVKAGESTLLNFKLLRVVPMAPMAVSVAGLKGRLLEMQVPEEDRTEALQVALRRQNRRLASSLDSNRGPASVQDSQKKAKSYLRHPVENPDPELKKHLAQKLTGSDTASNDILYPRQAKKHSIKHSPKSSVHGDEDSVEMPDSNLKKLEQKEKKKLLEDLSQLRAE